jgi:hypothetical protein
MQKRCTKTGLAEDSSRPQHYWLDWFMERQDISITCCKKQNSACVLLAYFDNNIGERSDDSDNFPGSSSAYLTTPGNISHEEI